MLIFPDINPIAFSLGPLKVHWYGITYLLGFLGAYWYCCHRGLLKSPPWYQEEVGDALFYGVLGVILGGRIGYVLLYMPELLWQQPFSLFQFWERGRSFHGGLLGVLLGLFVYTRLSKRSFLELTDFISPAVPIGLGLGRLGNFINGELWGRMTTMPWGMVFPEAGVTPRHPSQLYEMILEGLVLFFILSRYNRLETARGFISGLFLFCYGTFRFFIEFFREPDAMLGFLFLDWMTMGQFLSVPMIILGAILLNLKCTIGVCVKQ